MPKKLAPKQPIFGFRTVREARISGAIEARVCGHDDREPGAPRRPVMSERRVKKVLQKIEHGTPLGRAEARMSNYWATLQCMAIDAAMLRSAY